MGKKSCTWCLFLPWNTDQFKAVGEEFTGWVGHVIRKQCHRAINWGGPICINSHSEMSRNRKHIQKPVLSLTCSTQHTFTNLNTNSWSYKILKNRLTRSFPKPRLSLGFACNLFLSAVNLHRFPPFLLIVSLHPLLIFLFIKTESEN